MANIRSCNKHNMIACVEKTAQNADFYQVIDFSLLAAPFNYSHVGLISGPDGSMLQINFGHTATLQVINDGSLIFRRKDIFSNGTPFLMYPSIALSSHVRYSHVSIFVRSCHSIGRRQEEQSTSPHFRAASSARDAQGTPTQSAAHLKVLALFKVTLQYKGTAESHDELLFLKSTNDLLKMRIRHLGGEGLLDIYALNREVKRLKKQTLSQAKQILKLKAKLKKLSKFVQPVVQYHALWGEEILSEEHNVQEDVTTHHNADDTADQDAAVTSDMERRSDGTEEVNIEEKEASNVKSGETEELDLGDTLKSFEHFLGPYNSTSTANHRNDLYQQSEPWKQQMIERLLEIFSAEWDAEEEKKIRAERKGDVEGKEMYKDASRKRKAQLLKYRPSKKHKFEDSEDFCELRNYLGFVDLKECKDKEVTRRNLP
ncbi:hypothetical protein Tco_0400212 [Tanacetum coccineum]